MTRVSAAEPQHRSAPSSRMVQHLADICSQQIATRARSRDPLSCRVHTDDLLRAPPPGTSAIDHARYQKRTPSSRPGQQRLERIDACPHDIHSATGPRVTTSPRTDLKVKATKDTFATKQPKNSPWTNYREGERSIQRVIIEIEIHSYRTSIEISLVSSYPPQCLPQVSA